MGELDRGVLGEPSASAESDDAYLRHTDDHRLGVAAVRSDCVAPAAVGRDRVLCNGVDAAVHWACDRGETTRVSEGLAISAGGFAVVGREDAGQGLDLR